MRLPLTSLIVIERFCPKRKLARLSSPFHKGLTQKLGVQSQVQFQHIAGGLGLDHTLNGLRQMQLEVLEQDEGQPLAMSERFRHLL